MKRSSVIIALEICAIAALFVSWSFQRPNSRQVTTGNASEHFIRWVDFDVTADAMTQAFRYDVDTCQQEIHLNWVDLLAYLGARYGGDFSHYQAPDMAKAAEQLQNGVTVEKLTKNMTSFAYYREAYGAVLDGMVGLYEIEIPKSEAPAFALADAQIQEGDPGANPSYATITTPGADTIKSSAQPSPEASISSNTQSAPDSSIQAQTQPTTTDSNQQPNSAPSLSDPDAVPLTPSGEEKVWVTKYGLKAFLPLAKNFPYSHYDDFGVSRSYGYRRRHLGHDMMGQTGTPVIAVESGRVEALGWNQYGGWRIGIRSFDGKRYYYYAHLRKDYPYQSNLKEGSLVTAGDVIGYLGHTGYSSTENTNNIAEPHLHFGLQLIFDESQKEGNNEIWIDCYELIRFLAMNRSETVKKDGTKEWTRVYEMKDPSLEQFSTQ
ncbi:peptidoglycan DD-metalloendopeptidase family protein [Clostridium fessum]|uniref:peptidoglycan DD-metalloendopeptidase family protein n=1 Tax=Clostridium fessum TaxID=2126740 RepID=UPI002FD91BD9